MFVIKRDMTTLYDNLLEIEDFRRSQGQRFTLPAFLEMVILAGMSGNFGINPTSRFIANNKDFFIERYGLNHGVPGKTVIYNILSVIDYTQLNNVLKKWMNQFIDSKTDSWLSIDGKALCSTVTDKHGHGQNFQSIVSLFSNEMGIVVSTEQMEMKKSHEGEIARDIIEQLELQGVTFTLDALHCQKKQLRLSWIKEMSM